MHQAPFSFWLTCFPASSITKIYNLIAVVQREAYKEPSFEAITVVTGKGLRSGPEGPVLQTGVPRFLQEKHGPEVMSVEGNMGRFLIYAGFP